MKCKQNLPRRQREQNRLASYTAYHKGGSFGVLVYKRSKYSCARRECNATKGYLINVKWVRSSKYTHEPRAIALFHVRTISATLEKVWQLSVGECQCLAYLPRFHRKCKRKSVAHFNLLAETQNNTTWSEDNVQSVASLRTRTIRVQPEKRIISAVVNHEILHRNGSHVVHDLHTNPETKYEERKCESHNKAAEGKQHWRRTYWEADADKFVKIKKLRNHVENIRLTCDLSDY